MKYRRRIYYSAGQRAEIWDRWQRGESMRSIGRVFDRQSSSVFSVISPTGGIRPPARRRGRFALSLSEREEISRDPRIRARSNENDDAESHARPPEQMDALELRAAYHAMIAQIDDMVGSLCELLETTGQRENTLVIFMSDHGEMLGDHGLLYKGCRFYDGLVRVPLVISHPASVASERRSDDLVELVDLPQTILDFAGLAFDPQMQGMSLHPFLTDPSKKLEKGHVISEYFEAIRYPGSVGSRGSMYFDGRYKLSVYHDAGTGELFDQQMDPHEFNDLWDDPNSQELRYKLMERHFNAMMTRSGMGPPRLADY